MSREYPKWHSEQHPDFDQVMSKASAEALDRLEDDPVYRRMVLADPRDLHRSLYSPLTPPGYPEYAGTYRGTPKTTLEGRVAGAPSVIEPGRGDRSTVP